MGTPREKKIRRLIQDRSSYYSDTYIADSVGVSEREVAKIRSIMAKESAPTKLEIPTSESVGVDYLRAEAAKHHFAELLSYGRLFRDSLKIDYPGDIVHNDNAEREVWGTSGRIAGQGQSQSESAIEREWSTTGSDATKHTMYGPFRAHLADSTCWEALQSFQTAHLACKQASGELYGRLWQSAYEKASLRLPKALWPEEFELPGLVAAVLDDAWCLCRYGDSDFDPSVHTTEVFLRTWWVVELGRRSVHWETEEGATAILHIYQEVRSEVSDESLGTILRCYEEVELRKEAFQKSLSPDALLRKLLVDGHCQLCP